MNANEVTLDFIFQRIYLKKVKLFYFKFSLAQSHFLYQ